MLVSSFQVATARCWAFLKTKTSVKYFAGHTEKECISFPCVTVQEHLCQLKTMEISSLAVIRLPLFPDSVDKQTPMLGYLPGHMPYELGKELRKLGLTIVNKKADDTCHIDRNLITGASPMASNKLGRLAAEALLETAR